MYPNKNPQSASKSGLPAGASVIAFAAVAFVAVGAVAWIGLDAIGPSATSKPVFSAAPPQGTANQMMMALKAPRQRENEKARLALLNDEDGPMVVKPLGKVVELTQIDRSTNAAASQPSPELVAAAAAPVQAAPIQIETAVPEVTVQASAEVVVVKSCFEEVRDYAFGKQVLFGSGSAEIRGSELQVLREIGRMVEDCPKAMVHVTGHSDSSGPDVINLALSWQRADNTVAALNALGIDTARFEPVGFGARSPSSQGDSSDEERNRRVEFHILPAMEH